LIQHLRQATAEKVTPAASENFDAKLRQ
jgi:hypothetical protein